MEPKLAVDECLQLGTEKGLKIMTDKHTTLTGFLDNTLDVVFHVAILFTALVLLLQFIVGPLTTETMTDNVTTGLQTAMRANLKLTTSQKNAVRAAAPALQAMYRLSAEPSPEVTNNNNWLFTYAHTVSIFLFLIFGIMVWAFFRLLKSGNMAGPTIKVLRNNLLLIFPAILVAEFVFFKLIAVKMPPMLPSDLLTMLQEIVQLRKPAVSVTL